MVKKVVDIPQDLLIIANRYVGKDKCYATFNELVRDGIKSAIAKAKRLGIDRIGKEL